MSYMSNTVLLDTNLWIYFFSNHNDIKRQKASHLISENSQSIILTSQVLGEIFNVLQKKKLADSNLRNELIIKLIEFYPIKSIGALDVRKAIEVSNKTNYSYWDSLIIGSAINNNCNILYSEDLQHNHQIDNKLKIINPFI